MYVKENFVVTYFLHPLSSSEDETETLHQIFGSSDSESDFEAFVRERKQKASSKKMEEEEEVSEEVSTQVKEKPGKVKGNRRGLKVAKETNTEEDTRTSTTAVNETALKSEPLPLEEDKENRTKDIVKEKQLISKPVVRRPQFKKRPIKNEDEVLGSFLEQGLDKEDVLMMKLAFVKLRDGDDEMVEGMHWAYYPHDILYYSDGGRGRGRGREGRERAGWKERKKE